MALVWRDETNGAMAVLMVVPMHERLDPLTGRKQALKRPAGVVGPVFQSLEQRLRIRVVVADCRAAERGHHTQGLQGGQHRGAFHGATVIRVQHHLLGCNVFALANIAHDLTGQLAALSFVDLPAHDFSAKNIHEQVQVKVDPDDQRRQIGDVPAEELVGCRCAQRTRLAALLNHGAGADLRP